MTNKILNKFVKIFIFLLIYTFPSFAQSNEQSNFLIAIEKAFLNSEKIRSANLLLQAKEKLIENSYSGKDWNSSFSDKDGRDIISVQVKDAMFKFFITASLKVRAKRRFREYKNLNKKITYNEVQKSLRNRDKSDRRRVHGPLKKNKRFDLD